MVRVNLINPRYLSDQHLIAEYNEILMLASYIHKHQGLDGMPERYSLGRGHMKFFKDKVAYLKRRHELLKEEMRRRGFRADKSIEVEKFPPRLRGDWSPSSDDLQIIKKRLIEKIESKEDYYRYNRSKIHKSLLVEMIINADA